MKDHPIPQDVTGYKFHIVGNMTLKQFGLIVFGVIVAFIIYQLKLPALIAWPFIVIFAGGGLLAAFIPIEERPLDHWILTFIKTLYRPTQFYWQRKPHVPDLFNYTASTTQSAPPPTDLAPAKRARIHDYLNSLHTADTDSDQDENSQQLAEIMTHFKSASIPAAALPAPLHQPSMTVKVRALAPDPDAVTTIVDFSSDQTDMTVASVPTAVESPTVVSAAPTVVSPPPNESVVVQPDSSTPTRTITQAAGAIQVPAQDSVVMEHKDQSGQTDSNSGGSSTDTQTPNNLNLSPTPTTLPIPDATAPSPNTISSVTAAAPTAAAEAAQQPGNLPFPSPPSQPNVLVGMVVNSGQELLPGAIVEVATASGQVVRVVRTNALGQFYVTTPLPSGSYILQAEQDGLKFTPQQLEIANTPIAPILFRATG